jgi:WD40 repeat protein
MPDRLLQAGHTGLVQVLAYSADGRWLASGGSDRTIIIWEALSGDEAHRLTGHAAAITDLAFSPDGQRLISAGSNGGIKVWDVQKAVALYSINLAGPVRHVGFSADGSTWFAAVDTLKEDAVGRVEAHDAASGRLVRSFATKWSATSAMTITAYGRLLAAGGTDDEGAMAAWNIGTSQLVASAPVMAGAFSADGRLMARLEFSPTVRVVITDVDGGRVRQSIAVRNPGVLTFTPDAKSVVVADTSNSEMKIWSVTTGAAVQTLVGDRFGSSTPVTAIALTAGGRQLAAAPYAGYSIKSWDVAAGRALHTFYGQSLVQGIAISPDGRWLVAGSQQSLGVWDLAARKRIATLWDGPASVMVFSRDGRWLAVNTGRGFAGETLTVWDMNSRRPAADFSFATGGTPFGSFTFVREGGQLKMLGPLSRAWTFTADGTAHTVWSASTPVDVSADGTLLAVQAGLGGSVDVWDVASGARRATLAAHGASVSTLSFSPDGRSLVTAGADTPAIARDRNGGFLAQWSVKVWDVSTLAERFAIAFTAASAPCAAFSPDSRQLAVQKSWELVHVLDVDRGTVLAELSGKDLQPQNHQYSAGNLAFSRDGRVLLQGAQNGIRVWTIPRTAAR